MTVRRGRLPSDDVEVAPKSEPRILTIRAQVLQEFRKLGIVDDGTRDVNPERHDGTMVNG